MSMSKAPQRCGGFAAKLTVSLMVLIVETDVAIASASALLH